MPATNAREAILEAVKAKLESLTIANGYQNDVGRVERYLIPLETIAENEYPFLGILDDGAEVNLNDLGGQAGDVTVLAQMDLKLVGYFKDNAPATLSTGFNKFKADFDKLWWNNNPPMPATDAVLAGTRAEDVRLTGYDVIATDEEFGKVLFQANLRIIYSFLKVNP